MFGTFFFLIMSRFEVPSSFHIPVAIENCNYNTLLHFATNRSCRKCGKRNFRILFGPVVVTRYI